MYLCEVNAQFPGRFVPMILANSVQFNVWGQYMAQLVDKVQTNK